MSDRKKLTAQEKIALANAILAKLPPADQIRDQGPDPRPRIGPRIGGWRKTIRPPWTGGDK